MLDPDVQRRMEEAARLLRRKSQEQQAANSAALANKMIPGQHAMMIPQDPMHRAPVFPTFSSYMEQIREQAVARSTVIRQSPTTAPPSSMSQQGYNSSAYQIHNAMRAAVQSINYGDPGMRFPSSSSFSSSSGSGRSPYTTATTQPGPSTDFALGGRSTDFSQSFTQAAASGDFKAPTSAMAGASISATEARAPSAWLPAMGGASTDLSIASGDFSGFNANPAGLEKRESPSGGYSFNYNRQHHGHRRASQATNNPPFFDPYIPPLLPVPRTASTSFGSGSLPSGIGRPSFSLPPIDPFPVPRSASYIFPIGDAGPPLSGYGNSTFMSGAIPSGWKGTSGSLGMEDPTLRADSGNISASGMASLDKTRGLWDGDLDGPFGIKSEPPAPVNAAN